MAGRQPGDPPKFMQFCDTFGNFFIINLLFVISCVPIVTVGASINALCSMMIKVVQERDGKIVKGFFAEFKKSFLNSTIIWMTYVVMSLLIYSEWIFLKGMTGDARMILIVVMIIEAFFVLSTFPFVFWMNARYENTVKMMFINSFILFFKRFFTWLKLFVIWAGPIALMWAYTKVFARFWFFWVVILISFLAYVSALFMNKEFQLIEGDSFWDNNNKSSYSDDEQLLANEEEIIDNKLEDKKDNELEE